MCYLEVEEKLIYQGGKGWRWTEIEPRKLQHCLSTYSSLFLWFLDVNFVSFYISIVYSKVFEPISFHYCQNLSI